MGTVADDELLHYGVKRRSGRYPWGSGTDPYQHSGDFMSRVEGLQKEGFSEKEIAEKIGLSTTDLRMQLRVAKHERRQLEADRARSLRDDGLSLNDIAKKMVYANDSSIRALLDENTAINKNRAKVTADILKKELEAKGVLDVGAGVERELGISANTLKEALFILETEGYAHFGVGLPQVTNPGKQTTLEIIAKTDKPVNELQSDIYKDPALVKSVGEYHSIDGGTSYSKREYPASIDSDRVFIRYGDEGGISKDGVIELRRGVDDLSLGNLHYAQVRILVDDSHYLKGMAIYSDDIPEGYDIVFNTNKQTGTPKNKVLKEIKDDPNNPFGALIKANGQSTYIDKDGNERLSAINKLKEEGEWDTMSKTLSSQFLSKQPMKLINTQLDLTYFDRAAEYDEICSLTNPTIKKKLLYEFASECDGAAVHLKAAALPGQETRVILPLNNISDNEVFAPSYPNGQKIALVRFPHGGVFEIPIVKVNNKNKEGLAVLGPDIKDGIGISAKVAEKLSGADFDGDHVLTIPINDRVNIKSKPVLKGLEGFEPKTAYAERPGMKYMSKAETQKQMGVISNLLTDMTLRGAPDTELARAVRHSMVVIDAAKHKLDYKRSEKENGIAELQRLYQGYTDADGRRVGGASTLLSRRKQDILVPERQGSGIIDKDTGKISYKETGRTYKERVKVIDPVTKQHALDPVTGKPMYRDTGKVIPAMTKSKLLLEVDDVRTLSSGTKQENAYANYANRLKAMANEARKEYRSTGTLKYDSHAADVYREDVSSLNAKLNVAAKNAPKERRAQALANSKIRAQMQDNPSLAKDKSEVKKLRQLAIEDARVSVGASGKNTRIEISDNEWRAIQAGAISDNKLSQILRYTDTDKLRERAMPKATTQLSQAKVNKIKAMTNSGYTQAEIAKAIGMSRSVVSKYLNE